MVGVLGTVALVDGASSATADNKAREGATALNRELTEITRAIPYPQLNSADITTALQARPGLADSSSAAGYTIERRNFAYTLAISACSVDDAKDALGSHAGDVIFCPENTVTGTKDRNPDDYRRVTLTLTWKNSAREETARQTVLVTNPAGGLGPSVKDLRIVAPTTTTITDPLITSADFAADTTATPTSVEWYVNGAAQGQATGSGTTWAFTWPISNFLDGTYLVQARAFNEDGRSGLARTLTIVLNRQAPLAPSGVGAGRNGTGSDVDAEWLANGEGDVLGYRVYRTSGGTTERVCPPAADGSAAFLESLSCIDQSAPSSGPVEYAVAAIDTGPNGAREGTRTSVTVAEGNTRPATPTGLTACAGGTADCNGPDGSPAPSGTTALTWTAATDPDAGDAIAFYRVYRDGTGYGNRYDRLYPTGGSLVWIDSGTGGAAHDYRVTAVDTNFAESTQTTAVTQ